MNSERYDVLEDEFLADEHDADREQAFHDQERRDRLSEFGPQAAQWFSVSPEVAGVGPGDTSRAASSHDQRSSRRRGLTSDPSPDSAAGAAESGVATRGRADSSHDVRTPTSLTPGADSSKGHGPCRGDGSDRKAA